MIKFNGLDHLAIAVPDTEEALKIWQHKLGFRLLYSEKVNNNSVLLTHLDLGNSQLQLVQPLVPDSPLSQSYKREGRSPATLLSAGKQCGSYYGCTKYRRD